MDVARVIVLNKYANLDKALDYYIPSEIKCGLGQVVKVPLGPRMVQGIVVEIMGESEFNNLKSIAELTPRYLPPDLLELGQWLAVRAGCSLASMVSAMLPPEVSANPLIHWQVDQVAASGANLTEKQLAVVEYLRDNPGQLKSEIAGSLGISLVPINTLIKKGVLVEGKAIEEQRSWPLEGVDNLTPQQGEVVENIISTSQNFSRHQVFLLHGVTGSGKTEVYIRLAKKTLATGRGVLVLVPEIALTAQLVARFRVAFNDTVVLHSGLTDNKRAECWNQIAQGEAKVVIGTRSAAFAPMPSIGLLIIDEEHEPAFKQEETPRYHARDVALYRGRKQHAGVVMGSATPSLEAYNSARNSKIHLLEMPHRVHNSQRVDIQLVDMREELQAGNRSFLSRSLQHSLQQTLAKNEQAILFLNRRGLAPTVLCRSCGFRYSCPNCSTAYTLHRNGDLRCHHCDAKTKKAKTCPECGGGYLRELGVGTQKLEEQLQKMFPGFPIHRLDRDTAASLDAKEKRLFEFYQQGAGIMIGTQMIAKGLDFPNVTLVGIVLADLSLATADFRAAERTFQLVTQAAGRTGRGEKMGHVVIQTYQPEHYSLQYSLSGDYLGFFDYELQIRQRTGMPPFRSLSRVVLSSSKPEILEKQTDALAQELSASWEVLYSGPAPMEMLKKNHRWHIILRHDGGTASLRGLRDAVGGRSNRNCRVILDNNPYNFM